MFFDHITPVGDRAPTDALAAGYDLCIPRFLPYTTKRRLPSAPRLVRMYLRMPLASRVARRAGVPRHTECLTQPAPTDEPTSGGPVVVCPTPQTVTVPGGSCTSSRPWWRLLAT